MPSLTRLYQLVTSLLLGCAIAQNLPQVDLGYQIQQASSFNESAQVYNFSNIRYAQPPVGNLRWARPVPPSGRNPVVQNGSVGRICPQGTPNWYFISALFSPYILAGNTSSFNYTLAEQELQAYLATGVDLNAAYAGALDPRINEDCLFLDVFVPQAVLENATSNKTGGAPVLVWIHGGGYVQSSKAAGGTPNGLIRASQNTGGSGIIYVSLNYRLGALGFLSGKSLKAAGGVANAGLYDQRLAIEWVAKYIHLFGGDPNQVTIIGESAGGSAVQHQVTAFGGTKGVSFQRAIAQSPAFTPEGPRQADLEEKTAQDFLRLLKVDNITQARRQNSSAVIKANAHQIANSSYGQFTYGPVVDGTFTPQSPGQLLASGQHAPNISVMTGHNLNEAPVFTPPNVKTEADFRALLNATYPGITASATTTILNDLYPANYSGATQPYRTPLERLFLLIDESIFTCNCYFLNNAFLNASGGTYAYEYQVPPAWHGLDVPYTYYDGTGTNLTAGLVAPIALILQAYLTNFAMTGNPNGAGLPPFPPLGTNASMVGINVTGVAVQVDDTVNRRCRWWQRGLEVSV